MKQKDFYVALQNKCLNEHDLYDQNVSKYYEVIGLKLADSFNIAENVINKILVYSEFAKPEELLILEQIRQKLKAYSINEKMVNSHKLSELNGQIMYPSVSNLYYLNRNIFELYELFNNIQKIVYKNSYLDRNALLLNLQYLYYSEQYKECKKFIKNNLKKFNKEKVFLSHYELMCDFMLNKINYKKVEEVLKRNDYGGLVYCRGTIKVIIEDKNIKKLIEQYYKNEDIEYCLNTIKKENEAKISYIKRNEEISEYMAERDTRLKNINWYE